MGVELKAGARELDPFRNQKTALLRFIAGVTAEFSSGCDHPVTGDIRPSAIAHDVANGPGGARPAGKLCDITVRGHATAWNTAHDG